MVSELSVLFLIAHRTVIVSLGVKVVLSTTRQTDTFPSPDSIQSERIRGVIDV